MSARKTNRARARSGAPSKDGRAIAGLAMLMLSASCVPLHAADDPGPALAAASLALPAVDISELTVPVPAAAPLADAADEALPTPVVSGTAAWKANAAIPLSTLPNPRAASFVVSARSEVDKLRSLQCLAEAVYYEARSESEQGQRAVAQVVINRMRHPAYPSSICGVVYQGPMRPGSGCQFTFTCDGSLGIAPRGPAWDQARRIAAEALAGYVYAPVGYSTHYHTHEVLPRWAYQLAKSVVIGSHNFYRLQGGLGAPRAFRQAYAGREPSPYAMIASRPRFVPASTPGLPAATGSAASPFAAYAEPTTAQPLPNAAPQPANDRLPQSQVREEFATSGTWLADAPASR